jgi:hypothetical protein
VISGLEYDPPRHAFMATKPLLFGGGSFLPCLIVRSPNQGRLGYVK